ncbi:UDP-glucuronosyltransferase 3A1-like [Engystomops pustulosus]|uniref:UDP-glucuronosyltransferase 3A1-like n=1 Tax=Engystomops pustulosus TaxID=76066 RepID=UPI003AFB3DBA
MAGGRAPRVLILLCILHLHCLQGAKILTVCLAGGSHYLFMDDASRIFIDNGHDVRMFRQIGNGTTPGYEMTSTPYPVTTYTLDDKYLKEFDKMFEQSQKEYFTGNSGFTSYFTLMDFLAEQCQATMNRTDIFDFLNQEKFYIVILEAFNPCAFFVAEKLGLPYVALFTGGFINFMSVGLPSPPSYVPMFPSGLTNRMNFLERVKNTFMYLGTYVMDKIVESIFSRVSEAHFPVDSRPSLLELHRKAELWFYNVDFSMEFARPLLPHVHCIGGLRAKPAKPVSQDLEDFIAESGDSGFVVVTLGSMISSIPITDILREMNSAFASVPQKVIWRYKASQWPEDLKLAPNVKLMDWVNQNDLLGHPKMRLLVTHGGLNSLMEAIYHGVPVLGIPLFGDQPDNLVKIKAKLMGEYILPYEITSDKFAGAIHRVIENKSYKTAAMKQSVIMRSRPFPPDQQLLGWVEHIIRSGGGGHLRPYSYQQPWYQQLLLDVILFIFSCVALIIYIIVKVIRFLIHLLCNRKKQKQN